MLVEHYNINSVQKVGTSAFFTTPMYIILLWFFHMVSTITCLIKCYSQNLYSFILEVVNVNFRLLISNSNSFLVNVI